MDHDSPISSVGAHCGVEGAVFGGLSAQYYPGSMTVVVAGASRAERNGRGVMVANAPMAISHEMAIVSARCIVTGRI